MPSEEITKVSGDNFGSEVLEANVPVLVDFWATWCGPCRQVAPILDELAGEMSEKIRVAKLDVDADQDVAMRYNVQSIPTFILFKNGEVADRTMGALPKSKLREFIDRNL